MEVKKPSEGPRLIAYRLPGYSHYPRIVPASADRHWMDFTTRKWANRCLPLRIANQAGWAVLNPAEFEAVWTGKPQLDSLKLTTKTGAKPDLAHSMFGYGIVTFVIPYLFRTPEGFNLYVHGPSNELKDGIGPLDGLVETDWLPFPFTMNWRFTRPMKKVRFDPDEPICMIAPVRRGEVEQFEPEIRNLESEPELLRSFKTWYASRQEAQKAALGESRPGETAPQQGHYIRGEGHLGERAENHQNKLNIQPFRSLEPSNVAEKPPVAAEAPKKSFFAKVLGR